MGSYHINGAFLFILLILPLISGRVSIDLPAILSKTKTVKGNTASVETLNVLSNCVADPLPIDLFRQNGGSAAFGGPQNAKDGSIRFSGTRYLESASIHFSCRCQCGVLSPC